MEPRLAKMRAKCGQEVANGAQKTAQKAPGAAKRQFKSPWIAQKTIFEKSAKSVVRVSKIEGPGRSGEALGRQVGGHNSVQVRFGSPNWRLSASWQTNLAARVQLGAQLGAHVGTVRFAPWDPG